MSLIIGHSIRKKEFGGKIPEADFKAITKSAKIGLATPIKGAGLPRATRLLKSYATSPQGARRIAFLMEVEGGDLFLLFYRDKKDAVGANMTIQNRAFKTQLHKYLGDLAKDLEEGEYEVHEL
jgi:hypothetical protein